MTLFDTDPRKSGMARLRISHLALVEVVNRRERQAVAMDGSRKQIARSLALLATSSKLLAQPFGSALYDPPGGPGPDAARHDPVGGAMGQGTIDRTTRRAAGNAGPMGRNARQDAAALPCGHG